MGEIDPRIRQAIEFHERRALRFLVIRLLVVAVAVAVIVRAPWWAGVPVGILAFLFASPELIERTLLHTFRKRGALIKADPSKVVWVHYDAHGEQICPVFLYDRHADFAVLHLPSGYARRVLDAFRARETPPLITTTDEEKRVAEPRQKFLAKLHELEARVTSASHPALQALAPDAVVAIARLRERYGASLEATEGRDAVAATVDHLLIDYAGAKSARDLPVGSGMFNAEIETLLKQL